MVVLEICFQAFGRFGTLVEFELRVVLGFQKGVISSFPTRICCGGQEGEAKKMLHYSRFELAIAVYHHFIPQQHNQKIRIS